MVTPEEKARIKAAVNIVDVIESSGCHLKQAGANTWEACCPFHSEKTPSFKVSEQFQNYHCFGCGAQGDVISYLVEKEGYAFGSAIEYLADMAGIQLSKAGRVDPENQVNLKTQYAILKDTADFYRANFLALDDNNLAVKEITKRGLSRDNELYGYAPYRRTALYEHLSAKGYSDSDLLASKMISVGDNNSYYDFFYNRLVITLTDYQGRPVSFTARYLNGKGAERKWINGRDSVIYSKKNTLFNMSKARTGIKTSHKIIVAEGPFDVIAIEQAGFNNVVASCGTSFTKEHVKLALQQVTQQGKFVFAFDGDSAGIDAAKKVFQNYPEIHNISEVAIFPEGKDPGDLLLEKGPDAVSTVIYNSTPIVNFVAEELNKVSKFKTYQDRQRFVVAAANEILAYITDPELLGYWQRRFCVASGISLNQIEFEYSKAKKGANLQQQTTILSDESTKELSMIAVIVGRALGLLVKYPEILKDYTKIDDRWGKESQGFINQVLSDVKTQNSMGNNFVFIPERYSKYPGVIACLRKDEFGPELPHNIVIDYYCTLIDKLKSLKDSERKRQIIASATGALIDANDIDELAEQIEQLNKRLG